jgi:hypothetical protein
MSRKLLLSPRHIHLLESHESRAGSTSSPIAASGVRLIRARLEWRVNSIVLRSPVERREAAQSLSGHQASRSDLRRRKDAHAMRMRRTHGRAETAALGAVARMTAKGPQEKTALARLGVVADLASRRTPVSCPGPRGRIVRLAGIRFARPNSRRPQKSMCTSILQHADEGTLNLRPAVTASSCSAVRSICRFSR